MDHAEFIEKNIKQQLLAEGYSLPVAQGGANEGVDHFRRCSQASKKGAMFDDCLYRAKVWCETNGGKDEKPKKKPRARKTVGTLALF